MEAAELRRISEFFPASGFQFQIDPTYEPERHESLAKNPQDIPAPIPDIMQSSRYYRNTTASGWLFQKMHHICGMLPWKVS